MFVVDNELVLAGGAKCDYILGSLSIHNPVGRILRATIDAAKFTAWHQLDFAISIHRHRTGGDTEAKRSVFVFGFHAAIVARAARGVKAELVPL